MIGRLILTLAIGLGALPSRAAAQAVPVRGGGAVAGYISALDGRAAECVIQRGRKTLPARYWSDLLVGDRLIAHGACQMEIMPRDGPRRWVVMPSNSPTIMTDRARRNGPLPATVESYGLALTQWHDEGQPSPEPPRKPPPKRRGAKASPEPVAVRKPPPPPPLALPLLSVAGVPGEARQRLTAMPRRLNLAWIGGKPPFAVTLKGPDGTVSRFESGEERIVSSFVVPRTGPHEVQIVDAAGVTLRAGFEAVDAVPAIDQRDLAALPPGIARVLAAARLAGMDDGVWRLEAHARLADEGRDNYAASLLAARLLAGKPLPGSPLSHNASLGASLMPVVASPTRDTAVR